MSNADAAYIGQRWYHKKEKRFIRTSQIDLNMKIITEENTNKRFSYTSNGSVEWVRPVFSRDSKRVMIYTHDLLDGNGIKGGEVVWIPESNCHGIQVDGKVVELFIDRPEQYTVVGTAYELVNEF